ncbi:hypothetical protein ACSS6W_003316 [Trichoderma asperelloides]
MLVLLALSAVFAIWGQVQWAAGAATQLRVLAPPAGRYAPEHPCGGLDCINLGPSCNANAVQPLAGGWPTPGTRDESPQAQSLSGHEVTYMQIMQTSHLWPL